MKAKPITAGLALALAAMVAAAPQSKITKVTPTSIGKGVEISIKGESLETPKTFWVLGGTGYVVEFKASLVVEPNLVRVKNAGVDYVRYVRFKSEPPTARLLIKTVKGAKPTLFEKEGTWYVRFGEFATDSKVIADDSKAMQDAISILDKPTAKVEQIDAKIQQIDSKVIADDSKAMEDAISQLEQPTTKVQKIDTKVIADPLEKIKTKPIEDTKTATAQTSYRATVTPSPKAPADDNFPHAQSKVTLVFDQTDVLAILEALASQADINIISAPDVSPKNAPLLLTLSMKKVDLDFAMTAVTSLAGLRYTRIGNTFVVSKATNFSANVRPLFDRAGDRYETRVVNLTSGESKQIRDATLQAIPQDGPDGYYEIIDPTADAEDMVAAPASAQPTTVAPAAGGAATAEGAAPTTTPVRMRAKYIMLIGEPRRLDAIETYVRDLDNRISASFSLGGTNNYDTKVVPVMSGETLKIRDMLKNLLAQNPRKDDFSIEEAAVKELSEGEESTKMLLIAGPKSELPTLVTFASTMDDELSRIAGIDKPKSAEEYEKFYEVVELKYIEPTLAAFDLKNRVRGLHVTILPDPVTPGLTGEEKAEKAAAPADTTGQQTQQQTADVTRQVGHEQMRLVLRGTRGQLDQAKEYLVAVDIPSRQVAVELRIMEMSKEEALKLGLDWNILTGGRLTQLRFNQGVGTNITQGGAFSGTYQDNATTQFNVLGTLDQMSNRDNLIARPNTLISDGRSSHLFVGDTVRYIKTINASQNGVTVEVDEVEVGVTVDMLARIGDGGNIAFQLNQNYSILTGFTPTPNGGAIPQTSDRNTTMHVNMMDGETIALGGLIQDQDFKKESGVPFLKDLPIIGHLFKRTNNSRERTEVVFFLTAKVIEGHQPGMAAQPMKEGNGGK